MSSHDFKESQGRQFVESQAHQRNAARTDDGTGDPPPWEEPWIRQAVGIAPYVGMAQFDAWSRFTANDNPGEAGEPGTWTDDRVDRVFIRAVDFGDFSSGDIGDDYRRLIRLHALRWSQTLTCTDPRFPINATFERYQQWHPDLTDGGVVSLAVETHKIDGSQVYAYGLDNYGNETESGDPTIIVLWYSTVFGAQYGSWHWLNRTVDTMSGDTLRITSTMRLYNFSPPVYVTQTVTLARENPLSTSPSDQAELLCNLIDLNDKTKEYTLGDDPYVTRAMVDNEQLVVRRYGPTPGHALRTVIESTGPGANFQYPDTPTAGSLGAIYTDDQWFPVAQHWIVGVTKTDAGYGYHGKSLAGLAAGDYTRRHSNGVEARASDAVTPDNGVDSAKGTTTDSPFSRAQKFEKHFLPAAGAADSIHYDGAP